MDIAIDALVECEDGACGRVSTVIINPVSNRLTHIVVDAGSFPYTQHIVPISMLEETQPDHLRFTGTVQDFEKLEKFIEHRFIKAEEGYGIYPASRHVYLPYGWPIHEDFAELEVEKIPQGELAIHRGAAVEASDGRIGKVDQFLVDPASGAITHLLMLEDHLVGNAKVMIPVSAIDRIAHDVVHLKLRKSEVASLPEIPIRHK